MATVPSLNLNRNVWGQFWGGTCTQCLSSSCVWLSHTSCNCIFTFLQNIKTLTILIFFTRVLEIQSFFQGQCIFKLFYPLPVLGPLTRWCASTLGTDLLSCFRVGSDMGLYPHEAEGYYIREGGKYKILRNRWHICYSTVTCKVTNTF